jgi:hypothetical protein
LNIYGQKRTLQACRILKKMLERNTTAEEKGKEKKKAKSIHVGWWG